MHRLKIFVFAAVLLCSTCAFAQLDVAMQTLRQPFEVKVGEAVDSITADGDTVKHDILRRIPGRYVPYFSADSIQRTGVNLLAFSNIFRPTHKPIVYNPTPLFGRTPHPASVSLADSIGIDDAAGLSPLERARYDYFIAHPEVVQMTWDEIPDLDKPIRDGRRMRNKDSDMSALARLFTVDDQQYVDDRMKKNAEAPVSPWKISGEENLQVSQLFLSNWIKGGDNSLSLLHDLRFKGVFTQGRNQWENALTHKLGVTYTSTLGTRVSDDLFDLSSKYGFNAVNKWYYSFLFSFKTQLFRNYSKSDTEKEKPKSTLLSPAYLQFVVGMDYKTKGLSVLLSPYTGIMTVVADTVDVDPSSYSIPDGKRCYFVNGFSVTVNWEKQIRWDIKYSTKFELFYEYFRKDGNKRFDWENVIDVRINRFLTSRFLLELRYYDNESDRFQIKENFSIAFKFNF